jgi:hypothetical protein
MNDMITIEPSALAIIPAASLPTLIAADENDILGNLRAELAGYTPDASTESGRKEIGQKTRKIGVAKMDFKRLKDALLDDAKKQVASVNAEYKIIETNCDALRDGIDGVLEAYKQIERDRISGHETALRSIEELGMVSGDGWTADDLRTRLTQVPEIADRNWQEFLDRAIRARLASIASLTDAVTTAGKREAEARELAKLRAEQAERDRLAAIEAQAERYRQIARDAAAQATRNAEAKAAREAEEAERKAQAERDAAAQRERDAAAELVRAEAARKMAEARAEQERKDAAAAVARAEAKAEADRVAAADRAEQEKRAAVDAERRRVARQQAADEIAAKVRADDKERRRAVNREVIADLAGLGITEDQAKAIITAVVTGVIRHVTIGY